MSFQDILVGRSQHNRSAVATKSTLDYRRSTPKTNTRQNVDTSNVAIANNTHSPSNNSQITRSSETHRSNVTITNNTLSPTNNCQIRRSSRSNGAISNNTRSPSNDSHVTRSSEAHRSRVRFAPTSSDNESIEICREASPQPRKIGPALRKSKCQSSISRLMYEMQQYQKLVAELEQLILRRHPAHENVGECPEATWKARILIRSAQDADTEIISKLDEYERSVSTSASFSQWNMRTSSEARTAQTSCRKLRRDFNRSHKTLNECIRTYEHRQKAEINQLNSILWSPGNKSQQSHSRRDIKHTKETDFFDEAMRQRDLESINSGMHKVNVIYQELAKLVNDQQEKFDTLQDTTNYAHTNTKAAAEIFHCGYERRMNPFLQCGAIETDDQPPNLPTCGDISPISGVVRCQGNKIRSFDSRITFTDDEPVHSTRHTKGNRRHHGKNSQRWNHEDPYIGDDEGFHWMMPFQTIREDITSVREDIVCVGKSVVSRAEKQFTCR